MQIKHEQFITESRIHNIRITRTLNILINTFKNNLLFVCITRVSYDELKRNIARMH